LQAQCRNLQLGDHVGYDFAFRKKKAAFGNESRSRLLEFWKLTRASAFEFKQRIHRRIIVNSLDGFAQKSGH
jgi:hypothetical protein